MIDFYFWNTPNGYKVMMFLEEVGIPYRLLPVNIGKGEQFESSFLQISPNNRIPAIVDHDPVVCDEPVSIFESGAILIYLSQKLGRFLPTDIRKRTEVLQWLFWQVGGLGPMAGQSGHFQQYAPERIPYAIERYHNETERLLKVLDNQLIKHEFIAGQYSIADMACYPWVFVHDKLNVDIDQFPALARWLQQIADRPATINAYAKGEAVNQAPTMTEESRKILFGQNANTVTA